MVKNKVDYLIVGQGLAGTFLAFSLLQKGKTIAFVDKGHQYSSSFVAAGVINPIVLRRYTVTWRAKEFLAFNDGFYSRLDRFLQKKYHFKMPIKKLISSEDEEIFWQKRFHKDDMKDFIEQDLDIIDSSIDPARNFKVGHVKQTSWLNISDLLTDFRKQIQANSAFIEEVFDFTCLKQNAYKNIEFKNIVFCEGANGKQNPLFGDLPFSLNKGQLITVKNKQLPENLILKNKVFSLPMGNSEFKIGATYSWKWDTSSEENAHKIEPEKTELLQQHLEEITSSNYKIIKVETGIRPSIKDRRPLIGVHSENKNFFIFNGMGTRGCFIAPLLAQEFIAFAEEGKPLHPEVEISRF